MNKNVLYALLSIVSVQGTTYIAQLALARILPVDQFAVVRTVESTLQFLATLAPFGMSLLIVRQAPMEDAPGSSAGTLSSYVVFAACAGIVVALCAALITPFAVQAPVSQYLIIAVWSIVLTAVSRTCLNYFYGRERFEFIAKVTFLASCLSLILVVVLGWFWALHGWIAAKYAAEFLLFCIALYFFRQHLHWPRLSLAQALAQLREGAAVSLSLVCRSVIDNCFFLVFAYQSTNPHQVATYGACSLLLAGITILPASLNSVWLARYVNIRDGEAEALRKLHRRNTALVSFIGLGLAVALVVFGQVVARFLGPDYRDMPTLLAAMAIIVPVRAAAVLSGHVLFRLNRVEVGTAINVGAAILAIVLALAMVYSWRLMGGLMGVIAASVVVELIAGAAFIAYARRLLRWASARSLAMEQ